MSLAKFNEFETIEVDGNKCIICQKDKPITASGNGFWHYGMHPNSMWFHMMGAEEKFCDECFDKVES